MPCSLVQLSKAKCDPSARVRLLGTIYIDKTTNIDHRIGIGRISLSEVTNTLNLKCRHSIYNFPDELQFVCLLLIAAHLPNHRIGKDGRLRA